MAAFSRAESLLLAATDASADHRKQKDGEDWDQGSGARGQAEDKGEKNSGERGGAGNRTHPPGNNRKGH